MNKSSNKGITIIALVITIIVMLILAGVTINLTLGENGIFRAAIEAKEKQKISEYKEKVELARVSVTLNNMGQITLDKLIGQIYKENIVPDKAIIKLDEEKAKMQTEEGYIFIITIQTIEYLGKGEIPTPPDIQQGDITLSELVWNSTTHKANVKIIKTAELNSYQIQYQVVTDTNNVTEVDWKTGIEVNELKHNDYVCIRLWNGFKGGQYINFKITDSKQPTFAILETQEILTNSSYQIQETDISNIVSNTEYKVTVKVDGTIVTLPYTIDTSKVKTYEISYTVSSSGGENTKVRKIRVYNDYVVRNLISNSDFNDGATDWSNIPVSNGIAIFNARTASWHGFGSNSKISDSTTCNHEFYIMVKAKVPSPSYSFGLSANEYGVGVYAAWDVSYKQDSYEISSMVFTPANKGATNSYFGFYKRLATETEETAYVDYCMAIDLTATFGEGNEPSKEWLDKNLSYFETNKTIKYIIE